MTNRHSPSLTLKRRCVDVVLLSTVLMGVLSACTEDSVVPPRTAPPTPVPSASTASPSPTPTRMSPQELDERAAEAAVVRFWRVIDHLSANPKAKLEELTTVSRGSAAAQWRQNIRDYRYEQLRQTGRVALTNTAAKPSSERGRYDVGTCVDVSQVNLVDRDSKSVVASGRPAKVRYRYVVQRDAQQWYVIEEKATGTC